MQHGFHVQSSKALDRHQLREHGDVVGDSLVAHIRSFCHEMLISNTLTKGSAYYRQLITSKFRPEVLDGFLGI